MLHIALKGWHAASGRTAGGRNGRKAASRRRSAFWKRLLDVVFKALILSMFYETMMDELALLALVAGALHARQREIGLLAGLPLPRLPGRQKAESREAILRASAVARRGRAADALLVSLGDKSLLWSADGTGFLMYARQGGKLIALFDPVGPDENWNELASSFRRLARRRNCIPVFYQVSQGFLESTGMGALRGYKLGELAEIDLPAFTMQGGEWASLRRAINRAGRDGLSFELAPTQAVPALLDELKAVSDAWLASGGTREKRFSLGAFEPAYVASDPVAVVRLEGRVAAFATLLATENRESAFVDLMRFQPGVHRGVMDFLIVRLIEQLKADGFGRLNLGMAPLSGLTEGKEARLWDRIGRLVARHGNRYYGFEGLYSFKAKFEPQWQPRYLAVPAGTNPFLAAAATATLIAGGLSGVFGA